MKHKTKQSLWDAATRSAALRLSGRSTPAQPATNKNWFAPALRSLMPVALLMAHITGVAQPAYAAGAVKIVFDSTRDGNAEIYVMNPDGSGQTNLTNSPGADSRPTSNRDASKIAFTSFRNGNEEIYLMNADGTGQTRLTNNTTADTNAAFNLDGSKIVFSSRRDGNEEIYVMNADGTNQTRLTNNAAVDTEPSFGLDGRIYWGSSRDGNGEIYVMNADGSNPTRLTNNAASDADPSVSADGKIAFHSTRAGGVNIFVMNADGTSPTQLTTTGGIACSFSPDGSQLAYYSTRDGNAEIYTMSANGTNQTRLTTNPASDGTPNWGFSAPPSALSIGNASVIEGNSGTKTVSFTVTRSGNTSGTASVHYATANGTATASSDYVAVPDTVLSFSAGQVSKTITVTVNGDTAVEANETFFVNLSSASGATIAVAQGLGVITNDDSSRLSMGSDITVIEGTPAPGAPSTKTVTFGVTLTPASPSVVTVNYATVDGTATSASDYDATSGTLTFAPGETAKTIQVTVNSDAAIEPDELFEVALSAENGATVGVRDAACTIINDDEPPPHLSISDVQMLEGNSGNRNMYFTVSLSGPATSTITVTATTSGAPGMSNPATPTTDFFGIKTTVTLAPGATATAVAVPIIGDTTPEADEKFAVSLINPVGATIAKGVGIGTIVNDDGPGAAYLTNVALAPDNVTSLVGATQKFITTQRDSTGQTNMSDSRLLFGSQAAPAFYVRYDAMANKLYLRNDANSAWLGGFAPGTANVISNTNGSVDCAGVQIIRNGTDLVIVWALVPKTGLIGVHDVKLYAQNKTGLFANFEKKGIWTVTSTSALWTPTELVGQLFAAPTDNDAPSE